MDNDMNQIARAIIGISIADLTNAERIIYKILKKRNIVCERGSYVELTDDPELNAHYDEMEMYSQSQEWPEDYPF